MCCCGKPTINGMVNAYSWDGHTFSTRAPNPPPLLDGDVLLYDEPGRCGGIDAHSHHFRLVKAGGEVALLVRHGGGDEALALGCTGRLALPAFDGLDTNARYWLLHAIYSAHSNGADAAASRRDAFWRKAAAQKRIVVRKVRGRDAVEISVEPEKITA